MLPFLLTASLALSAPAPLPRPSPNAAALNALQGTWDLVLVVEVDDAGLRPWVQTSTVVAIRGDRMVYSVSGQSHTSWVIVLDATARPARFDTRLVNLQSPWLGNYALVGNTLHNCYAPDGQPRPAGLVPALPGQVLHILQRRK